MNGRTVKIHVSTDDKGNGAVCGARLSFVKFYASDRYVSCEKCTNKLKVESDGAKLAKL